jgi:hypothetical protein
MQWQRYKCSACDRLFNTSDIIRYHLQSIHNIFVNDDPDEKDDYVTSEEEDVTFYENMSKQQKAAKAAKPPAAVKKAPVAAAKKGKKSAATKKAPAVSAKAAATKKAVIEKPTRRGRKRSAEPAKPAVWPEKSTKKSNTTKAANAHKVEPIVEQRRSVARPDEVRFFKNI